MAGKRKHHKSCGQRSAVRQENVSPGCEVTAGLRRFNRRTCSGKRALLAYHEAGHAVVFCSFTWKVLSVSLRKQGESLGRVSTFAYQGSAEYFEAALP